MNSTAVRVFVAALSILTLALQVAGQANSSDSPTEIEVGLHSGAITNANPSQTFQFSATNGEQVSIIMEAVAGELDPFLLVYDSSGELIVSNDDLEQGNPNAMVSFSATNDTYTIVATRYKQADGTSEGDFELTLEVNNDEAPESDILQTIPAEFSLTDESLAYSIPVFGTLDEEENIIYYALRGERGDYVRLSLTSIDGNLEPMLNIFNQRLEVISRVTSIAPNEVIVHATLPVTGWYLIEAIRTSGSGNYVLIAEAVSNTLIEPAKTIPGELNQNQRDVSYVFDAKMGDVIYAHLIAPDTEGFDPQVSLMDIDHNLVIGQRAFSDNVTLENVEIPRSGPYIVNVSDRANNPDVFPYEIELDLTPVNVEEFIASKDITEVNYNNAYSGDAISDENPVHYYSFSGKFGELVSIEMQAAEGSFLDPYVILLDEHLNELAFNDNSGNNRDARIIQFSLPEDGRYIILATRNGIEKGNTTGEYDLEITAGQIDLLPGDITATVEWESGADLNLFVHTPNDIISWSNPQVPEQGALQVESNTHCETLTRTPVEHAYLQQPDTVGDIKVWVWYQNDCNMEEDTSFKLTVTVDDKAILILDDNGVSLLQDDGRYTTRQMENELFLDERFEFVFYMNGDNLAFVNEGVITKPTPQQQASEGGDLLMHVGDTLTDSITDDVYARFYQFHAQEGEKFQITMDRLTGNLDPYLVLRSAIGDNLYADDDNDAASCESLRDSNSACLLFTAPEESTYHIAVTRFGIRDGETIGDYRLALSRQTTEE